MIAAETETLAGEALDADAKVLRLECRRLERSRDWAEIVRITDPPTVYSADHDGAADAILIGLARVRALFHRGRARDALATLHKLEADAGSTWETRKLLATISTYFGEYEAALAACTDALISLPLNAKPGQIYRDLCVQRTEILTMLDRKVEARRFLIGAVRDLVPKYAEFAAIRRTVDSAQSLEEFFGFLTPMFSYPGHRARSALHHYSLASRDHASPARAIAAARQRFLSGLDIVEFGSKVEQDKSNWSADAALALHDLRADLESIELAPFLISGTLLGCVREGQILGHDKDIDLGVFSDRPAAEVKAALRTSGRFSVRPLITEKLVQVQHANGVMLDVFLHWRQSGMVWHEGQKARWWNSDFALRPTEFLGQEFLIPTDPETYLVENYGPGWRVPEPDFETFVDTPNMSVSDEDHLTWYFFSKLHDYYHAGKPKQFRKVWNALEPRIGGDAAVRSAVEMALVEGDNMLRAMTADLSAEVA